MRPTAFGIKAVTFYLTIVAAYFVSPYTNLFFLLLSFLSTLLLLSAFSTFRNLGQIQGQLTGLVPYPAGSSETARLQLKGDRRKRFNIRASIKVDGKRHELGKIEILQGEAQIEVQLPALPRGLYAADYLELHSNYPLGLLRRFRQFSVGEKLVVHPEPLSNAREQNGGVLDEVMGEVASHSGDMGPAGVRDYQAGDPLKLIHWRASARRRELVVKELEGHSAPGIELQLDRRCSEEKLEVCLSLITALAIQAQEGKRPLALHTQGQSQTYGEGHASFNELMCFLAATAALPANAEGPPPVSPTVVRLPGSHLIPEAQELQA
ncbi:MAG: DUF58 domain-containing protein [Planctomycetota bacterium]|jgi:uncharacterized protein (DUF58 family)